MRTFFALVAGAVLAMSALPVSAKTTHMGLAPGAHKGDFIVQYVSLIPFAPKAKRATMLWVDADQRVPMRQYLGLPIDVRIHPMPQKGIYAVQILREDGTEITEMSIGFMPNDPTATSTFVNQRIQIMVSDYRKLLAQPFPKSFAEN
jgi:hypothetical protein